MGNVDLSYKSHASGLVTPRVEENRARAFGLIVRVHSLFIFDVDNIQRLAVKRSLDDRAIGNSAPFE